MRLKELEVVGVAMIQGTEVQAEGVHVDKSEKSLASIKN